MFNAFLAEKHGLKTAIAPVDANTAAITGARVGVAKGGRVAVVVNMGTSTAAVVQFKLRQHTALSGGTSKDLDVANPYYYKAGAATSFTKVEPTVADADVDLSTQFAADGGIVVFEVLCDQLDTNNGFAFFSLDMADSTAAKLVSAVYEVQEARFLPMYSEVL